MPESRSSPRRPRRITRPQLDETLAQSLLAMLRESGATFPRVHAAQLIHDKPVVLKRMAKFLVQQCFRNTVIEDYHAGYGRGGKGSAITQSEMKTLMIEAVNNTYSFLWVLFRTELGPCVLAGLETVDPVDHWNAPCLDPKFAAGIVAMLSLFAGTTGSAANRVHGKTKERRLVRQKPPVN